MSVSNKTQLSIALGLPILLLLSPVQAQSTKQRLGTLEQQVFRLERILENNQEIQTDMLRRIQTLQSENQELRNEIETLQFESNRSVDRQRELYIDLDHRLQGLEAGTATSAGLAASGEGAPPGSSGLADREAYQLAFDQLKQGNYQKAGSEFTTFLATYTVSELRDNAQYWLAETNYVTKKFELALDGFQQVITQYPASRKIPDAWLKVGYCNYELEQWADARQALNTVSVQYPESTAARLAKERLVMMDGRGG